MRIRMFYACVVLLLLTMLVSGSVLGSASALENQPSETPVARSFLAGDTWQESDTGLGAVLARSIAISPFNADEAYAATQVKGILHTPDGGRSWQSLSVPMGNYRASIAPDPFTDGRLFIGYGDYEPVPMVRVSTDHGDTYTEHALALPPEYATKEAYVSAITPDPSTQNHLLAGVSVAGNWPAIGPGFIYTSTDGGSTWSRQSTPAGTKWILHLAYDPQDAGVIYAATNGTGLLRSDDGGATWAPTTAQPAGTESSTCRLCFVRPPCLRAQEGHLPVSIDAEAAITRLERRSNGPLASQPWLLGVQIDNAQKLPIYQG